MRATYPQLIADFLSNHDDLIIKGIITPLLSSKQLKPILSLLLFILLEIAIDQQLIMQLIDYNLLAVDS